MEEEKKQECCCRRVKCPRHGRCEECLAHHAKNPKHPPACLKKNRKALDRQAADGYGKKEKDEPARERGAKERKRGKRSEGA